MLARSVVALTSNQCAKSRGWSAQRWRRETSAGMQLIREDGIDQYSLVQVCASGHDGHPHCFPWLFVAYLSSPSSPILSCETHLLGVRPSYAAPLQPSRTTKASRSKGYAGSKSMRTSRGQGGYRPLQPTTSRNPTGRVQ
jgi:hypothetical protein